MRKSVASPEPCPKFVSQQVTATERYYLDLNPGPKVRMAVVCGGWERLQPEYVVERETFPFLCVEYVAEGAGTLELHGQRFPLRPGIAFAYAPGIAHRIQNDRARPMRKYYVDFSGREAAGLLSASLLGKWIAVQISSPREVEEIFDNLQRDATAGGGLEADLSSAHLRLLLLKIAQLGVMPQHIESRGISTYQRTRRHIERHFVTLQNAEDIARGCHMTPGHLSRIFRTFGQGSPYQFLMRLKMQRASELLLESGMMVKEVAAALGFSSQFQFSRAFKRVHGLAPDHFIRQNHRKG